MTEEQYQKAAKINHEMSKAWREIDTWERLKKKDLAYIGAWEDGEVPSYYHSFVTTISDETFEHLRNICIDKLKARIASLEKEMADI